MSRAEAIEQIKDRLAARHSRLGSWEAVALTLPGSGGWLCNVRAGTRQPNEPLAKALGVHWPKDRVTAFHHGDDEELAVAFRQIVDAVPGGRAEFARKIVAHELYVLSEEELVKAVAHYGDAVYAIKALLRSKRSA